MPGAATPVIWTAASRRRSPVFAGHGRPRPRTTRVSCGLRPARTPPAERLAQEPRRLEHERSAHDRKAKLGVHADEDRPEWRTRNGHKSDRCEDWHASLSTRDPEEGPLPSPAPISGNLRNINAGPDIPQHSLLRPSGQRWVATPVVHESSSQPLGGVEAACDAAADRGRGLGTAPGLRSATRPESVGAPVWTAMPTGP